MATKILFEVQGDDSLLSFTCTQPVTQETILRNFPLAGKWHFRAKVPSSAPFEDYVWLDLGGTGRVPTFDGTIHLKAFPVDVNAIQYDDDGDDLIIVEGNDEPHSKASSKGSETSSRPRRGSNEQPVKDVASGISSMFGKALASSKAAMEAVRKNVGN